MKRGDFTPIENLKKGDRFAFKSDIKKRVCSEVVRRKGMTTYYSRNGRRKRHFKPLTPVMFIRHVPATKRNNKIQITNSEIL